MRKSRDKTPMLRWHEVYAPDGHPRPGYQRPLQVLEERRNSDLRELSEHMEATLRELGVNFGAAQSKAYQPWTCDLLPHIFSPEDWEKAVAGIRQRVKAFELFLRDVYGKREILREGVIPIHPVLGSPYYLNASVGLARPHDAYLHVSGICLARDSKGALAVKHHQFSRATGISYMMQNRRALARVLPELFEQSSVSSLARTPLALLEELRSAASFSGNDPMIVLLSPGIESPVYSDHSFLARRMGIPLVQGGDLLVLDDHVHLKTVRGLRQVDVVYNQVADAWLDPLVFRKGSMQGVPGLVHCVRRGTVAVTNAIGSQLADDRALLCFAPTIIRYYLSESPILPMLPTYWLGDIDQCEMVLERMDEYEIGPIVGHDLQGTRTIPNTQLSEDIRRDPSRYVAQPVTYGANTIRVNGGSRTEFEQDHLIYALRDRESYEVFPGALTRVFKRPESGTSWVSKDSWVSGGSSEYETAHTRRRRFHESRIPSREVTSRVAESFYWLGRYLERAYHKAYLIQVVETLENEELNAAERKLYRPMWNRLLPPLETSAGASRRSITTRVDRYRLMLLPEAGSVLSTFSRAMTNASSVQEALSPESWATLSDLQSLLQKTRYKPNISDDECARIARRLSETVTARIPQFFAIASRTILGDDGWRFCEAGEMLERAAITANAVLSISKSLARQPEPIEIELSAFLRLMGTRDAYRRIYMMRAEPIPLLELLWQHPEAPRSITRCLSCCQELLRQSASPDSAGAQFALDGIGSLLHKIRHVDWTEYLHHRTDEELPAGSDAGDSAGNERLAALLGDLLSATLDIHNLISDGFLSHQAYISQTSQPAAIPRDGV